MRTWKRSAVVGTVAAAGLAAAVTATLAAALEPDGVHLRGQWTSGGSHARLELEDRNVEPVICFVWENDLPQDGDGIASRILTRAGEEAVDLGVGDQWIDGAATGCEIPHDERFREVFADPGQYVVEVRVVEDQGTPATPPLTTGPLEPDGGGSVPTSTSGGSGSSDSATPTSTSGTSGRSDSATPTGTSGTSGGSETATPSGSSPDSGNPGRAGSRGRSDGPGRSDRSGRSGSSG